MTKSRNTTDPAVLAAYDAMIASVPGVVRKGDAIPYTSINGNMYSSISKADKIGIRLAKADLEAFLTTHKTTLFEALPGFLQKEYASVPPALLADVPTLQAWFRKSHAYASGLRPKKTTR
jgi:hypothetical protein